MAFDLRLRFESVEQFSALAERAAALGFSVVAAEVCVRLPPATPSEAASSALRRRENPTFAAEIAERLAAAAKSGSSFVHPLSLPVPLSGKTPSQREASSSLRWLSNTTSRLHAHFTEASERCDSAETQQSPRSLSREGRSVSPEGLCCGLSSGGASQWRDLFPFAVEALQTVQRAKAASARTALLQLRRVTVELGSTSAAASLSSLFPRNPPFNPQQQALEAAQTGGESRPQQSSCCVELLAVRPTDASTWEFCCASCRCDIICLDLAASASDTAGLGRLPFQVRRRHVLQAVRRGVFFEISLSDLLPRPPPSSRGGKALSPAATAAFVESEAERCRAVWNNMQKILRFAPPKQLLISSGALSPHEVRPPAEAAAIGAALGVCTLRNANRAGGAAAAMGLLSKAAAEHACGGAVTQGWPSSFGEKLQGTDERDAVSLLREAARRSGMPACIEEQLRKLQEQLLRL